MMADVEAIHKLDDILTNRPGKLRSASGTCASTSAGKWFVTFASRWRLQETSISANDHSWSP